MRRWPLLCGALLACSGVQAAAAASEQTLTTLLRQETATLSTLTSLAGWIDEAEQEQIAAQTAAAQLDYKRQETARRGQALRQRLQGRREHLKQRLRPLYKMSRGGVFRLLLEAANAQELSLRLSGALLVLDRDLQELQLYQRELGQLERHERELERIKHRHASLQQQLTRRQRQFKLAQQKQRELLERLRESRRAQQRATRDLSRYQRTLLERIAASDQRLTASAGFLQLRGRLRAPIAGPVVGRFGQITDRSQLEILRTGLTYGPAGQRPVQAVAPGRVQLAGPLEGYGQLVLIDHGEGYLSLYGFLSRLEVAAGDEVAAGARLGQSGRDPLTAKPALYFELRRGRQPLDPWPWLRP